MSCSVAKVGPGPGVVNARPQWDVCSAPPRRRRAGGWGGSGDGDGTTLRAGQPQKRPDRDVGVRRRAAGVNASGRDQ